MWFNLILMKGAAILPFEFSPCYAARSFSASPAYDLVE
jgi:hypothetical protein